MTRLLCAAALALMLATPTVSHACQRWGMPCYNYGYGPGYGRGWADARYSYGHGWVGPRYGYPARYYGGGYSGYYRVGNVIINGRRWGDIGYRYSRADLIRW
jgi:hypothetical protein